MLAFSCNIALITLYIISVQQQAVSRDMIEAARLVSGPAALGEIPGPLPFLPEPFAREMFR